MNGMIETVTVVADLLQVQPRYDGGSTHMHIAAARSLLLTAPRGMGGPPYGAREVQGALAAPGPGSTAWGQPPRPRVGGSCSESQGPSLAGRQGLPRQSRSRGVGPFGRRVGVPQRSETWNGGTVTPGHGPDWERACGFRVNLKKRATPQTLAASRPRVPPGETLAVSS